MIGRYRAERVPRRITPACRVTFTQTSAATERQRYRATLPVHVESYRFARRETLGETKESRGGGKKGKRVRKEKALSFGGYDLESGPAVVSSRIVTGCDVYPARLNACTRARYAQVRRYDVVETPSVVSEQRAVVDSDGIASAVNF